MAFLHPIEQFSSSIAFQGGELRPKPLFLRPLTFDSVRGEDTIDPVYKILKVVLSFLQVCRPPIQVVAQKGARP